MPGSFTILFINNDNQVIANASCGKHNLNAAGLTLSNALEQAKDQAWTDVTNNAPPMMICEARKQMAVCGATSYLILARESALAAT